MRPNDTVFWLSDGDALLLSGTLVASWADSDGATAAVRTRAGLVLVAAARLHATADAATAAGNRRLTAVPGVGGNAQ